MTKEKGTKYIKPNIKEAWLLVPLYVQINEEDGKVVMIEHANFAEADEYVRAGFVNDNFDQAVNRIVPENTTIKVA